MTKLLHKPRQINNPTVFYKVGDYKKEKTEAIFEGSPANRKAFLDSGMFSDRTKFNLTKIASLPTSPAERTE